MIENQRVRLTRHLLRESLIVLLTEKSIHRISVREICEKAQINRTTFYKYYGSPYDLLVDIEDSVLSHIETQLSSNGDALVEDIQRLTGIITYMDENITLCRLLINNTVGSRFPERLLQLPNIRHLLGDQLNSGYQDDEAAYVYQFIVSGGYAMIKAWVNHDERERPEKMAAVLLSTVGKILK